MQGLAVLVALVAAAVFLWQCWINLSRDVFNAGRGKPRHTSWPTLIVSFVVAALGFTIGTWGTQERWDREAREAREQSQREMEQEQREIDAIRRGSE